MRGATYLRLTYHLPRMLLQWLKPVVYNHGKQRNKTVSGGFYPIHNTIEDLSDHEKPTEGQS